MSRPVRGPSIDLRLPKAAGMVGGGGGPGVNCMPQQPIQPAQLNREGCALGLVRADTCSTSRISEIGSSDNGNAKFLRMFHPALGQWLCWQGQEVAHIVPWPITLSVACSDADRHLQGPLCVHNATKTMGLVQARYREQLQPERRREWILQFLPFLCRGRGACA